jgi:hypothetical protein
VLSIAWLGYCVRCIAFEELARNFKGLLDLVVCPGNFTFTAFQKLTDQRDLVLVVPYDFADWWRKCLNLFVPLTLGVPDEGWMIFFACKFESWGLQQSLDIGWVKGFLTCNKPRPCLLIRMIEVWDNSLLERHHLIKVMMIKMAHPATTVLLIFPKVGILGKFESLFEKHLLILIWSFSLSLDSLPNLIYRYFLMLR